VQGHAEFRQHKGFLARLLNVLVRAVFLSSMRNDRVPATIVVIDTFHKVSDLTDVVCSRISVDRRRIAEVVEEITRFMSNLDRTFDDL